jgi:hypothetical protein
MPGLYKPTAQLWPLFAADLQLARRHLEALINRAHHQESLCALVPQLTFLGAYSRCEELLERHQLLSHPLGRQSQFRIERQRCAHNPWKALIPAGEGPQLLESCRQQLVERDRMMEVELVGGLGDILENHALISNSFRQRQELDRLSFRISSNSAWQAIGSILAGAGPVPCLGPESMESPAADEPVSSWTAPLMRCVLCELADESPPEASLRRIAVEDGHNWAFNWRTKPDPRYPISSFSRSVPFAQIVGFYQDLLENLPDHRIKLHDLSDYTAQEAAVLQGVCPSVALGRAQLRTLADTLDLLDRCNRVISVDTSLTHLRACTGRPAMLMLPMFADERWLSLLRAGCYAEHVTVLQQTNLHDWDPVLQQLVAVLCQPSVPLRH